MATDIIKLTVDLAERSYPILIGSGLLQDKALLLQYLGDRQMLLVSNETIAPLYIDAVQSAIGGQQQDRVIVPDGEQYKHMATIETIIDGLMASRHNRTTTLVALGGGGGGDMTGFAAACYQGDRKSVVEGKSGDCG